MTVIHYNYHPALQPPAPFINVVLRHPRSGSEMRNVPAQVDSGADRTVLPEKVAHALGLPQVGRIEINALGGAFHFLPSYCVLLGVHDFPLRQIEVIAHAHEEWILLGRDVLNAHRIVLDGPRLALEIS